MRTSSKLSLLVVCVLGGISTAEATDIKSEGLRLADGVTRMSAYETPKAKYVVANSTPIFADVRWASKVTGHLERGEQVSVLAVPKQWDWLLVGQNGVGIGYIPRGVVAPADQFKTS